MRFDGGEASEPNPMRCLWWAYMGARWHGYLTCADRELLRYYAPLEIYLTHADKLPRLP
jgi:hypothetical protein